MIFDIETLTLTTPAIATEAITLTDYLLATTNIVLPETTTELITGVVAMIFTTTVYPPVVSGSLWRRFNLEHTEVHRCEPLARLFLLIPPTGIITATTAVALPTYTVRSSMFSWP